MSENENLPSAEQPEALAADKAPEVLSEAPELPEVVVSVPQEAPAAPVVEEVKPAPAPEVKAEPVQEPAKKIKNNNLGASELGATTLAGEGVKLSKLVYKAHSRNSASVIAVKTRLIELGYTQAQNGRIGWVDDDTVEALKQFQTDRKLEVDGIFTRATVEALLAGTKLAIEE